PFIASGLLARAMARPGLRTSAGARPGWCPDRSCASSEAAGGRRVTVSLAHQRPRPLAGRASGASASSALTSAAGLVCAGLRSYCNESCITALSKIRVTVTPGALAQHRGGGTPHDTAGKPNGAAPPTRRGAAGDQGEQGQERRCRRRGAAVVAFQDQQVRARQDGAAAAGGREAARLLPDHRGTP